MTHMSIAAIHGTNRSYDRPSLRFAVFVTTVVYRL
jgi:hypothetical protein